MDAKKYGYYTLYRPPMPGAIPRGAVEMECLDDNPYAEDIRHNVWGKVWYDRPLTDQEIRDYELKAIPEQQMVWTVSIQNLVNDEADIWVTSFDSREKADGFVEKVNAKTKSLGVEDGFRIHIDAGAMNDEMYLDWFDDLFGED